MENVYLEKLIDDCVKGIKSGLDVSDFKKAFRSYYRLKDVIVSCIPENNRVVTTNTDDEEVIS